MNARRRPRMRRLVDNTVALVQSGELSAELAAQKLLENGVPVAVIGRVLGRAVSGSQNVDKPSSAHRDSPVTFPTAQTAIVGLS